MVTSTHHVCQNGGGGSSGALPAAHPIERTSRTCSFSAAHLTLRCGPSLSLLHLNRGPASA